MLVASQGNGSSPRARPPDMSATWSNLAGLGGYGEITCSFPHNCSAFSCGLKREKRGRERPFLLIFQWRNSPSTVAQYGFPLSASCQDFFLTDFGDTRMNVFASWSLLFTSHWYSEGIRRKGSINVEVLGSFIFGGLEILLFHQDEYNALEPASSTLLLTYFSASTFKCTKGAGLLPLKRWVHAPWKEWLASWQKLCAASLT